MSSHTGPALRHRDKEMIPRTLVRAMFALAIASLAIVSFAVLTDRPTVGQPKEAAIVDSREMVLDGDGHNAVTVHAADGTLIADMENGGFVAVVLNGLARERMKHGIDGNPPVRLVAYDGGRLSLQDPETGWAAEIASFGLGNKAAFERLMTK